MLQLYSIMHLYMQDAASIQQDAATIQQNAATIKLTACSLFMLYCNLCQFLPLAGIYIIKFFLEQRDT